MFEIDKKKFGAFVSELRKENGYTQKELAETLFLHLWGVQQTCEKRMELLMEK